MELTALLKIRPSLEALWKVVTTKFLILTTAIVCLTTKLPLPPEPTHAILRSVTSQTCLWATFWLLCKQWTLQRISSVPDLDLRRKFFEAVSLHRQRGSELRMGITMRDPRFVTVSRAEVWTKLQDGNESSKDGLHKYNNVSEEWILCRCWGKLGALHDRYTREWR